MGVGLICLLLAAACSDTGSTTPGLSTTTFDPSSTTIGSSAPTTSLEDQTGGTSTNTGGTSTTVATTTSAPDTVTDTGSGDIGYLGCSSTTDAVVGYHLVGGTRLWDSGEGEYSGGALALWANRVGINQMWAKFQQKLDANPDTRILWWQLCTTDADRADHLEQGLAVLGELERRLPGGTIYVSPQQDYDGHVCTTSGPDGPAQMGVLATQLVSTGRVLAGPIIGPLTQDQTRDGCHANESGRLMLGEQVLAFFDG